MAVKYRRPSTVLRRPSFGRRRSTLRGSPGLLIVAAACVGVTNIGCGPDIYLLTANLAAESGSPEFFQVELCVDGSCQRPFPVEGADLRPAGDAFALPSNLDSGGEVTIEVNLTDADGDIHPAAGAMELESFRPNGAFTRPRCAVADLIVGDGVVSRAPEGLFPPRPDR